MNVSQDKLLARIQKLLALANHPGTGEAEAANAAARIQDILAEHNLSMAEVASHAERGRASGPAVDEARAKTQHDKAAMYRYQRHLMQALAKNNFCMHFLEKTWKRDARGRRMHFFEGYGYVNARYIDCHYLLGRQVNVVTTQITYDYLVETMDRLLPYQGMDKRGKDALLWLDGCTTRLIERLDEQRTKREEESREKAAQEATRQKHPAYAGNGTALVVLSDVYGSEADLNHDALYGLEPGTTARRKREQAELNQLRHDRMEARAAEAVAADPTLRLDVARMMEAGWDREGAEVYLGYRKQPNADEPKETDAQRLKRERREQAQHDRFWSRQEQRWKKRAERENSRAYRAGAAAGETIGLDAQVGHDDKGKLR